MTATRDLATGSPPAILIPGNRSLGGLEVRIDPRVPLAFTVDDVLTRQECVDLIRRIDAAGPTLAPVSTKAGPVMRPDIRNNTRVMFDDAELAAEVYRRLSYAIPHTVVGMHAVGANERLRCYRYEAGQRFAPHFDGAFRRNEHEVSLLTLIIYLNEGFAGGSTSFLDYRVETTPRAGRALLFQHRLWHEGSEVTSGVKYVLRSDVMYRR